MGTIIEVGSGVTLLEKGDRIVLPFVSIRAPGRACVRVQMLI
jgi:threonine dehydrogenase-like Zn-dependent dehydrogenase